MASLYDLNEISKIRQDENAHLGQMSKSQGFKILQKIAKEFEEINIKSTYQESTSHEARLLKLGEISGMRKLLAQVVSRSENEDKTASWTQ